MCVVVQAGLAGSRNSARRTRKFCAVLFYFAFVCFVVFVLFLCFCFVFSPSQCCSCYREGGLFGVLFGVFICRCKLFWLREEKELMGGFASLAIHSSCFDWFFSSQKRVVKP